MTDLEKAREAFTITEADIGRYVRRKSTGEIGKISKDPGNGWLHTGIVYEWKWCANDFEYVEVTVTPSPTDEVAGAVSMARDIIRQREGLLLVLTGYEREQKAAENKCLETLIQAAQASAVEVTVEDEQPSRKRALHPSMLSASDLAAIAIAEVPEQPQGDLAKIIAYWNQHRNLSITDIETLITAASRASSCQGGFTHRG
jgi:hypothetical protein